MNAKFDGYVYIGTYLSFLFTVAGQPAVRIAGAGRIVASVHRIGQGTLEQSAPKKSEDSASQHESPCFHLSRSIPPSLSLSLPLFSSSLLLEHVGSPHAESMSADSTSSRRPEFPRLDMPAIYVPRPIMLSPRYIQLPKATKSKRTHLEVPCQLV